MLFDEMADLERRLEADGIAFVMLGWPDGVPLTVRFNLLPDDIAPAWWHRWKTELGYFPSTDPLVPLQEVAEWKWKSLCSCDWCRHQRLPAEANAAGWRRPVGPRNRTVKG